MYLAALRRAWAWLCLLHFPICVFKHTDESPRAFSAPVKTQSQCSQPFHIAHVAQALQHLHGHHRPGSCMVSILKFPSMCHRLNGEDVGVKSIIKCKQQLGLWLSYEDFAVRIISDNTFVESSNNLPQKKGGSTPCWWSKLISVT